jgi:hypothetical protein
VHGGRGVPLTGELEKAKEVYALWYQTYPRDWAPRGNLTSMMPVSGAMKKPSLKFSLAFV